MYIYIYSYQFYFQQIDFITMHKSIKISIKNLLESLELIIRIKKQIFLINIPYKFYIRIKWKI